MSWSFSFSRTLTCIVLRLTCGFGFAGEKNITINMVTVDWEPYYGSHLRNGGFFSDICREVFYRAGYTMKLTFMPWARALKGTFVGKYDGILGSYYVKERVPYVFYSIPVYYAEETLFSRAEDGPRNYTSISDLSNYRLGIITGHSHSKKIDYANNLTKVSAPSLEINIKRLMANRVDLIVSGKLAVLNSINVNFPEWKGKILPVEPALESPPLYIALSRKLKGHKKVISDFNQALNNMKKSGEVDNIAKRYGF